MVVIPEGNLLCRAEELELFSIASFVLWLFSSLQPERGCSVTYFGKDFVFVVKRIEDNGANHQNYDGGEQPKAERDRCEESVIIYQPP